VIIIIIIIIIIVVVMMMMMMTMMMCNFKERIWFAWFRLGIWRLRVKRRGVEKGRCL